LDRFSGRDHGKLRHSVEQFQAIGSEMGESIEIPDFSSDPLS
jgi:hypothetical protein